jgi:amino acid transporter
MEAVPKKELGLFDSTCIIVGIIIGAGIYETAPTVAACMGSRWGTLVIWVVGGLLALAGALCYAELAAAYPREGGDYVYLNRGYGRWAGYMFGWSQLMIIRPGDIALMGFIFGRYASRLYPFEYSGMVYPALAIVLLTIINVIGVREGKWTQNILTTLKAAGLVFIVVAGVLAPGAKAGRETGGFTMGGMQLALILVLFTYGGWNEMAYVAAEVKRPERNIVRALVTGTAAVMVLYILVNSAFLHSLGYANMAQSQAVASDAIATVLPRIAGNAMSILVCISTLGAANGLIFTGARISYAMGTEHALFSRLGVWSKRFGTPVAALVWQGVLSLAIVVLAGSFVDTVLYTAPVFWLFILATAVSVFVLRRKEPKIERPYRVGGYPVTPVIFSVSSAFMLYNCISYALEHKPKALGVLLGTLFAGVSVYLFTESRKPSA